MPNDDVSRGVLRIQAPRLGQVREVIEFLQDLENAYDNLFVFDSLMASVENPRGREGTLAPEDRVFERYRSKAPSFSLVARTRVSAYLLPQDRLVLRRIEFSSPGFWEIVGSLSPLEVLRKWSSDRHERKKDTNYRSAYEAERMKLENERLWNQVVSERILLLERAGVPQERIREAISRYMVEPLTKLERHQDAGLFEDAILLPPNDDLGKTL